MCASCLPSLIQSSFKMLAGCKMKKEVDSRYRNFSFFFLPMAEFVYVLPHSLTLCTNYFKQTFFFCLFLFFLFITHPVSSFSQENWNSEELLLSRCTVEEQSVIFLSCLLTFLQQLRDKQRNRKEEQQMMILSDPLQTV